MGIGKNYLAKIQTAESSIVFNLPATAPTITQQNITLKDSALVNMNVDKTPSVTAIYKHAPASDELFFVYEVPLILIDSGTMAPAVFGSLVGALTNGLELVVVQAGVEKIVCNVKNNLDLALCFFSGNFGSGLPAATGFLETVDYVTGSFKFDTPVLLDGSKNDELFFRVQDDLTGLDFLEASVKYSILSL